MSVGPGGGLSLLRTNPPCTGPLAPGLKPGGGGAPGVGQVVGGLDRKPA